MNVFLSWSGERSQKVAEAFNELLSEIIQAVKPFYSPDIDKGKKWEQELSSALEYDFGIICLTPENINAEWILFESGALSKIASKSNVATFLIDLKPNEVKKPLSMFQHTIFTKTDMLKLFRTINKNVKEGQRSEAQLEKAFEKWWPDLENKINEAIKSKIISEKQRRSDSDKIDEILQSTRGFEKNIFGIMDVLQALRHTINISNASIGDKNINNLAPDLLDPFYKEFSKLSDAERRAANKVLGQTFENIAKSIWEKKSKQQ